ncbi:signal peptidase I [Sporosarcina luteola]|uniref:signal peptidase I n=1 Tax=Sporosarcina luteola TaxID=582850 RepID=UPI00203B9A93|nr:signal peptidase I [Sporosarcina luteola]MCM3710237.1 signal peptidase I [Sporosarcina luteola]MCM3742552.1 signal peptidase I [Sporosarcina luteola]
MKKETTTEILSWIKAIVVACVLVFAIRHFLFSPVIVSGQSMEPTFESENRVIISKIHKLDHFDLVVFHAPGSQEDYIKRVIGLPGDTVVMKDDKLFINGKEYEENYIQENKERLFEDQKLTEDFEVTVPDGQLFVLGDNRRNSTDSRIIGCIDQDSVVGKVGFRFYPLNSIGIPK